MKTQILVVEDEIVVAENIQSHLKGLGYGVPGMAVSGEEAIEKVGAISPDLVLMDIKLAGDMDGIEAAEQIRSRFNVPVVYLTQLMAVAFGMDLKKEAALVYNIIPPEVAIKAATG